MHFEVGTDLKVLSYFRPPMIYDIQGVLVSKYGIGPSQQDKIAKYTGPTQSYQRSKE